MQFDAKTSEYFLELLRSVLHDRPALPKPQDVSWKEIFEFAKYHSLSYMAYCAIRNSSFTLDDELENEWSTRNSLNLVKYYNQEYERERLCELLSKAGISYLPMKGSVIRDLFPSPEMREMCDLDILVHPEDIERVHEIMLADGYSFMKDMTTSHDREYHKLPYLNVEIHTYLLPQDNKLFSYYSDCWDKFMCREDGLRHYMTFEDSYIYMLAHAHKHFYLDGTGIRSVLDVYLMQNKHMFTTDREYVVSELNKLGILDFANIFERLADCWFAKESAEIPQDLLVYHFRVLESSTYGDNTLKSNALGIIETGKTLHTAKLIIAVKKIFPPYRSMRKKFPILKYFPPFLPFFWLVRWVKTVFVKPERIASFFRLLKHLSLPGINEERR